MNGIAGDRYDERKKMVDEQLVRRGISDVHVVGAFTEVRRHRFVPASLQEMAYKDHPLPIGRGQTISQPYMVALMTQHLSPGPKHKVLEIGTGSGYQTAILARMCGEVFTMEREEALLVQAKKAISEEGCDNVRFFCGDGTEGLPEWAPFDRIIITAAAPHVPEPLKEQLAEGGRMVIPVGTSYSQTLAVVEKEKGVFKTRDICGCVFVPLIGKYGWRNV